ncbi:MAG: 2,3-bisphosphoglycerate-independent phosphoglycerate mutase [Myxococcales bacterium]|nr:2,3-bisphosphoglycerate-independent phosphoglycerate mutase [Myxococcales bacterium]
MTTVRPVIFCVLDGWGLRDEVENNAVRLATTPTTDHFTAHYPSTRLFTSGEDVGLPAGQMGNSEVGHMNLGAGRIVYQDLLRIDRAVGDGSIADNAVFDSIAERLAQSGGALHLLGLVSNGGVHSSNRHLFEIVRALHRRGLARAFVHVFTDGRDTPPQSADDFVPELERMLASEAPSVRVASVSGRFYAMDRDKRWERVRLAWEALVDGRGETASSGAEAVRAAYARGETDEFIKPTVVIADGAPVATIRDGDAVFFFNFRADRARQLSQTLGLGELPAEWGPRATPKLALYATMTQYHRDFPFPVAFPPVRLSKILGEVVSAAGVAQLRCAETEKYAHVTFFFNGGEDKLFEGEERQLVQSPREVTTYDQKPEMSARGVTDVLLGAIRSQAFGMIICNFANPDMVGHCGKLEPAIRAVETVDRCVGELYEACRANGVTMLVTADHGNCETMVDPETGEPHTAHTTNPVPCWLVGESYRDVRLREGILADVAPTLLELMGLPQPDEMTGRSLILS